MRDWIIKISVTVAAMFAPAAPMILTVLALCLVDLITGIWAARKRGESITSAGISRTVVKLLVYETAILLAWITQLHLTGDAVPVAKIVASLVGITELLSCLENINTISGTNLLKTIIEKLGSKNQ